MKITNVNNLPEALVNSVSGDDSHAPKDKHFSATTLLKPTREILLNRRHYNEIEQDVSDMLWLIFGAAIHKYLENHDNSGFSEYKLEIENIVDDYTLTGICDLYNKDTFTVEDYKTCSVYKFLNCDFNDWYKQGMIYAYMLRHKGYHVAHLKFHGFCKDWTPLEKRIKGNNYPEHALTSWSYDITETDYEFIERFIVNKFKEIIEAEKLSDVELPLCTDDERWFAGNKYAVYKHEGDKKALKVFNNEEDARTFMSELTDSYLEIRVGENRKCMNYCICKNYCDYYKELVDERND